ncbi:hypothetical protein PQX77_003008 [Marasmius sp. AFHP31]|nr:hypothetical protein PQX77_003008 [Marasmius sp. AFHP31]
MNQNTTSPKATLNNFYSLVNQGTWPIQQQQQQDVSGHAAFNLGVLTNETIPCHLPDADQLSADDFDAILHQRYDQS